MRAAGGAALGLITSTTLAQEAPPPPCAADGAPLFEDYAVARSDTAERPTLQPTNAFARRYATLLGEGLRDQPVDFAGHHAMVTWGCGTSCLDGGWVDLRSGEATPLPFMLDSFGLFDLDDPLRYRSDSRLLVMLGFPTETREGPNAQYHELRDGTLYLLCEAAWTQEAADRLGERWGGLSFD